MPGLCSAANKVGRTVDGGLAARQGRCNVGNAAEGLVLGAADAEHRHGAGADGGLNNIRRSELQGAPSAEPSRRTCSRVEVGGVFTVEDIALLAHLAVGCQ